MNSTTTERLILVQLRISSWSGMKGLQKSELPQAILDQLPPDDLASLGSKRLVDPKMLNPFDKLRRRAHRFCELVGVNRGAACYLVSESALPHLEQSFMSLRGEFDHEADKFVSEFDAHVDAWLSGFGQWKQLLMQQVPNIHTVRSRFNFDWMVFDVQPSAEASQTTHEKFDRELESARSKLLVEVAEVAGKAVDTFIVGKDYATQRVVNDHLKPLADKLSGLALLSNKAQPLSRQIQDVMAVLPKTGRIEGGDFIKLQSVLMLLSDADRAEKHAEALLRGDAPSLFKMDDSGFIDQPGMLDMLADGEHPSLQVSPDVMDSSDKGEAEGIDWDALSLEIPETQPEAANAKSSTDAGQPANEEPQSGGLSEAENHLANDDCSIAVDTLEQPSSGGFVLSY